jgi:hypothetical protein
MQSIKSLKRGNKTAWKLVGWGGRKKFSKENFPNDKVHVTVHKLLKAQGKELSLELSAAPATQNVWSYQNFIEQNLPTALKSSFYFVFKLDSQTMSNEALWMSDAMLDSLSLQLRDAERSRAEAERAHQVSSRKNLLAASKWFLETLHSPQTHEKHSYRFVKV